MLATNTAYGLEQDLKKLVAVASRNSCRAEVTFEEGDSSVDACRSRRCHTAIAESGGDSLVDRSSVQTGPPQMNTDLL